ncbi:hypothetical protein [Yinghuangia sp. YIM S10712]|uniref:hypothetical protein n=1 Tax=Yinghuangia sp. YIM S10712 TaxID=3436930 RepID=UPI003F534040
MPAVHDVHDRGVGVGDGLGEAPGPSRQTASMPGWVLSQAVTVCILRSGSTSIVSPGSASVRTVA